MTLFLSHLASPVGDLTIIETERGLARVGFDGQDEASLIESVAAFDSDQVVARSLLDSAAGMQLSEYFDGARTAFTVSLDLGDMHGFRKEATLGIAQIPFGQRMSYGEVAEMLGHPRAARALGTVCARNPIPFVLPCHRVVKADGRIGEYGGKPEVKAYLLDFEQRVGAGKLARPSLR